MRQCDKCGLAVSDGKFYLVDSEQTLAKYFLCLKCAKEFENAGMTLSKITFVKKTVKSNDDPNANNEYIPKCPTCSSPNIERISLTDKAVHAYAFGFFSNTAKSQFKCKNCGYKW